MKSWACPFLVYRVVGQGERKLGVEDLGKMAGSGRATGVRNRKAAITNFQTFALIQSVRPFTPMAASKSKAQPMARPLEGIPPDQKPGKNRTKLRKPKGKELLLQPQPDHPSEPGPSSEVAAEIEDVWSWTSLADSSASTHPAVFTKDGRYVFMPSDHLLGHSQRPTPDISFPS